MNQDIALGLLRHLLTAAGGLLVAKGYAQASDLDQVTGLVVALVGAIWSIVHKLPARTLPKA